MGPDQKFSEASAFRDFPLWEKAAGGRIPVAFDLEITARCNHNCRHCYINLPAGDREAEKNELTLEEIDSIAQQAVQLGSLWCLISGGEPLLRRDFPDIYRMLKKKGLLVSVFTSGSLIRPHHIELFKKYPPREIEITVYGVTEKTYDSVTRTPGSYRAFRKGLDMLLENGIKVRLKAMALKSNIHEFPEIARFCRAHTMDYFRFDPLLHLRYDRDPKRNREIIAERLTPEEITAVEQEDPDRSASLDNHCDQFIFDREGHENCNHLFHCGAGKSSFSVSPEGIFRLCPSLWHPDFIYNLRKGSLKEAWEVFVPGVLQQTSNHPEYLDKCRSCTIINLCLWCPAHAYLETGYADHWVKYFCDVAHARAAAIHKS